MSEETASAPPVDKDGAVITALKTQRQTPWHTVAEGIGDGGAAVVVRTFRVVDAEGSSAEQIAQERAAFAASLRLQQEMGDVQGSAWAKVRRICESRTELYGVMEKCQGSVAGLVEHCVPANPKLLYEMTTDVVGSLEELWKTKQRSHENMKAGNILERKGSGTGRSIFLLADPAHVGKKDTSANDLFELGGILFELVEHKKFDAVNGRIHGGGQWDRLGGQKRRWIEFCEFLLNPAGCQEPLADVKKRVARLKPPSKVMRGAVAAAVLGGAVLGAIFVINTLRHNQQTTVTTIVTTAASSEPSVVELRIQALQDLLNQKLIDKAHFDSLSPLVVMNKPPENAFDKRRLDVFEKAKAKELKGDQIMAMLNQIDKDDPSGAERAQREIDAKVAADLAAAKGLLQTGDVDSAIDGFKGLLVELPKTDRRRAGVQDLLTLAQNQQIESIFAKVRTQLDKGDLTGANATMDALVRMIPVEDAAKLRNLQALRWQAEDMRITAKLAEAQKLLPDDPKGAIKMMDDLLPTIAVANAGRKDEAEKIRKDAGDLLIPNQYENRVGIVLMRIRPGSFMMGSPETEIGGPNVKTGVLEHQADEVLHRVTLTKGFFMASELVTVDQFRLFVEKTGYVTDAERQGFVNEYDPRSGKEVRIRDVNWQKCKFPQTGDHPVTCVTISDVQSFCDWLKAFDGHTYRLPTEAQWEYCCRAGTQTAYFWGNDPKDGKGFVNAAGPALKEILGEDAAVLPFDDGYYYTSPVDAMKPNPWGLNDMLGNAWEWTSTYYGDYPKTDDVDPVSNPGTMGVVVRGGAWGADIYQTRSAYRSASPAEFRNNGLGFRLVTDLFPDPGVKVEVVRPKPLPATAPATGPVRELH